MTVKTKADVAVIDPVCGMVIDPGTAVQTRDVAGETVYFCSDACAKQFDQKPQRFLPNQDSAKASLPHSATTG